MIAKKTSKNQLTLPKRVVDRFPDVEYFAVRVEEGRITLIPVRPDELEKLHAKMASLGLSEQDVAEAVRWARERRP
jgi:hypothetical protein